jgi:pyruvate,water dikinase
VPDAFLVDAAACAPLLEPARAATAELLPRPLADDLASCLDLLGPVAVRSSAVREDGAHRAAAGHYESVLAVADMDGLAAACRTVVLSQLSAHVRSYWGTEDEPPRNEMSLILQRMLAASSSGVIFTADPVRGREDVFVLEACFGLATSVVQGGDISERATIGRSGEVESRTFHQAASAEYFDAESASVVARRPAEDGVGPVLSEAATIALIELAAAVEDLFGIPVDIEWSMEAGQFFLLQARAITTGRSGS